jgi:hypothetical protein
VAVSEAFGLGVDEFQEHIAYDNVELKIGPKNIVYTTGDSGRCREAGANDQNPQLSHLDKSLRILETWTVLDSDLRLNPWFLLSRAQLHKSEFSVNLLV